MRFRKNPVEVDVNLWSGDDQSLLFLTDWTKGGFRPIVDGVYTAEVYDYLHDTWVKAKTGQYIVQGVKGEFYPIDADVLAETYSPA